jgi:hypothetical protein
MNSIDNVRYWRHVWSGEGVDSAGFTPDGITRIRSAPPSCSTSASRRRAVSVGGPSFGRAMALSASMFRGVSGFGRDLRPTARPPGVLQLDRHNTRGIDRSR